MRYEHLYIHVPFCARRCTYCDFSIAVRRQVPAIEFADAVRNEWKRRHAESSFVLDTLYFGGGTPSKLGGDGVARMVDVVHERATLKAGAEVTLEANPEDITTPTVRAWMAAGVNRLSIGVQSFDDSVLSWMHRTHSAATARSAIDIARNAGIRNVSIDLIFAAPASLARDWERDLDRAGELRLPHLSVYGLTVEPRTPLGKWVARDSVIEAPEEAFEAEFLAAHTALTQRGYMHYEVSNYSSADGFSRHNWAYWERKPYAALGPSAHEFDGSTRRWNTEAFAEWEAKARAGEETLQGREVLTAAARLAEETYLTLRTRRGLTVTDDLATQLAPWIQAGWATHHDGMLRLTALGWLRLDSLAADLTARRSRY